MSMTLEKIEDGIYKWGFYPALFLLREAQDQERYEDCKLIKQALDKVGKGREWYVSSNVDDNSMKENYNNLTEGMSNMIHHNMAYYIDDFRKFIIH